MRITPRFHERIKKSRLSPGDVVIVRTGSPGTATVIPDWLNNANCSDLVVIRTGADLDPWFLTCFLNSEAKTQIYSYLVGAVQQHFNIGSAKDLRIPLPNLDEQREIAGVFRALQDKIELNHRMNRTLESMARTLFKSWFVDFDPVVAKTVGRQPFGMDDATAVLFPSAFKDFEREPIPSGWAVKDVYSVCNVQYGAPFASEKFNSDRRGLPLIRIRDLSHHAPVVYTDEEHPKTTTVVPGDIVAGMDGEFRTHVWRGPMSLLNQRLCMFIPKEGVSHVFLYFSVKDPLEEFENEKVGTTVNHLGKADIDRIRIVVPTIEIMSAFAKTADPWLSKMVAISSESTRLGALRDALLPELLSGELRLGAAGKRVDEAL